MRFCSLGSGSTGNSTLVQAGRPGAPTSLVIDCGFSLREFEQRLARKGLAIAELSAVFVTHEHADHIGCALGLARRHGVPLWMSRGTWRALGEPDAGVPIHFARDGDNFAIGELALRPFTVPHDAAEPLQLRCSDGATSLGILTDAGSITPHMLAQLQRCDALVIECNHDRAMLAASRYPASLKSRIGGRLGHLSNDTAAALLEGCMHAHLQHLVAAHLSLENNRPELARASLASACGAHAHDVIVADAQSGFDWLALG